MTKHWLVILGDTIRYAQGSDQKSASKYAFGIDTCKAIPIPKMPKYMSRKDLDQIYARLKA